MDDAASRDLQAACEHVPLFPLPGVVFLPSSLLPLHVFEPRYRDLVVDCLAGNRLVCVPQLRPGWEEDYQGRPGVWPVAGVGRVVRHQALPDGRHNVILLGLGRVRIVQEYPADFSYRVVRAAVLPDRMPSGGEAALRLQLQVLRALAAQVGAGATEAAEELRRLVERETDPARLIDKTAHLVLREPEERQAYLELDDLGVRAERVTDGLAGLLALGVAWDA